MTFIIALLVATAPTPKAEAGLALFGAPNGAVALTVKKGIKFSPDGVEAAKLVLRGRGAIEAAAFDQDGSLWVARSRGKLGVRTPDGKERWTKVPGAVTTEGLAVRDGVIVWRGTTKDTERFMVSTDAGQTFVERPSWSIGSFETAFTLGADGRIQIIAGWEASCGGGYQARQYGGVGDEELPEAPWNLDVSTGYAAGAKGWAFVASDCGDKTGVCAMSPTSEDITVLEIPWDAEKSGYFVSTHNDETTWIAIEKDLFAATEGKTKKIAADLPEGTEGLALVKAEPWVLANGLVYQRGTDTWERVAAFK